jgi:hypothetical protein
LGALVKEKSQIFGKSLRIYSDLSTELILDLARLDGIRRIFADNLVEVLDTHCAVFGLERMCVGFGRLRSNKENGAMGVPDVVVKVRGLDDLE